MNQKRSYRAQMKRAGLVRFRVRHKETDLFVQAERDLAGEVSAWVVEARGKIEAYARSHPGFIESYTPLPYDPLAPEIVRGMLKATNLAGVGPMASVAGAIAEYVGRRIAQNSSGEIMVENGGDIFLRMLSDVTIGIYAGTSPFSGRVGLMLKGREDSFGVCTSSGTIGHSFSFGSADAVCVISESCALADAAATAAGNLVKKKADVDKALAYLKGLRDVEGGVVIKADAIGAFGALELVPL